MDAKSRLVFPHLVAERARATPDRPCLVTRERTLSWAAVDREANRWARGLAARGVAKGDRVLVMIPSGIDHVLLWLGLCRLGALIVPVNDAYRGGVLRHQARDSDAALAIVDGAHLPRWDEIAADLPSLRAVAVYGEGEGGTGSAPCGAWDRFPAASLRADDDAPLPEVATYRDPMAIFYTSGTTGPSKGVLYSYAQAHATAAPVARLFGPDDVFYMFLPMFHVGLSHMFGIAAISGCALAIRPKFSARAFWDDVRHFGATGTILLSSMPHMLLAPEPSPAEREHQLSKTIVIPLPKDLPGFRERFATQVTTLYNMTEVSCPLAADGFDLADDVSCGRPRPGVQARIVDEHDEPVPDGAVGELVLRADEPWEFNLGYWRQPEKTAEAWRNQWLHTGDAFRRSEAGDFYFVDRIKDAIRRRGENISSFEVEAEVEAHPAILEAAAVAAPAAGGEDELRVVAALKPGAALEPAELHAFLQARMPRFMLPRFIELTADELPKTPTGKIRKAALREAGTADSWDAEAPKGGHP